MQNNTPKSVLRNIGAIRLDTGLLIAVFVMSYVTAVLGGAATVAFILQPTAITFALIVAMTGLLSVVAIHAALAPHIYDDPELPATYKKILRQLISLALMGASVATVLVVFLILLHEVLL